MIYFTSDLHYGYQGSISHSNRPFKNVDEMNTILLSNWNKKVGINDIVYILGDLSFRVPVEKVNTFIKQLNGKNTN